MHQPEQGGRDGRGGGVGVAKCRGPADAHQQQRQDRRGAHHQHHQPLAEQVCDERLLSAKVGHQHICEAFSAAGEHGGQRQQKVEGEAGQAVQRQLQRQAVLEQPHAGRPQQRHAEQRQEPDHAPVVRDTDRVDEHRAGEPLRLVVDTVLQQAADDVGEQQHVEHLAGAGGGVLPETQLQPAHQCGKQRGHPVAGQAQQRVRGLFALPLLLGAVVREQHHGAYQQRQRQCPEKCGQGIHGHRHCRGR